MNAPNRKIVRVSRDVFDELDHVLGAERSPGGHPSANDFLTVDFDAIVDDGSVEILSIDVDFGS